MAAAKVIMAEIREKKYDTSTYSKTTDIHNTTWDCLQHFLTCTSSLLITCTILLDGETGSGVEFRQT